jgi:hypothetical protein
VNLYVEFWQKNKLMNRDLQGYLFFNGKQVSETSPGVPLELNPKENAKESYILTTLKFPVLMEKSESATESGNFKIYQNPGEYEVKFMRDKRLTRSIKFSIGADGKIVQNNIGKELISNVGILVPSQILGTIDGNYNKLAWKDGVWGNPISNLIVP